MKSRRNDVGVLPATGRWNVFISWSGETSKEVALALREWLPFVINAARPWMSGVDIPKGARWNEDVSARLAEINIGIICLSPENLQSEWIHFEAGALSKAVSVSRVCVYLFGVGTTDLSEPLSQFMATRALKEDTKVFVQTINDAFEETRLTEQQIERAFEKWWPELENRLKSIRPKKRAPHKPERQLLDELLGLVRSQTRALATAGVGPTETNVKASNLSRNVIQASTSLLRCATEELRARAKWEREAPGTAMDISALRDRLLQRELHEIRGVFEADSRGIDRTTWPHDFFKAALFVPDPEMHRATSLRRIMYDYPEGLEPSPGTEHIDLAASPRSAGVLAFQNQDIVVIEDIKAEIRKPVEKRRWKDLRPGQAEEYESMVCASVVSGRRLTSDRRCIGVLVIDTNRERYFQENRSFQAFLGNLLNPFRTILTFFLEMEDYFS